MEALLLAILIGLKQPDKPRILPLIIPLESHQTVQIDVYDEIWGNLAPKTRQIAMCESSMRPDADNGVAVGIMQINFKVWGKYFGVTREQLKDLRTNLEISKKIYNLTGDFSAWECNK